MKPQTTLGRREFLKSASQTAAAVAIGWGLVPAAAPAGPPTSSAGELPVRTLGKTGLKLPILGYGGAALVQNLGTLLSFKLLSFKDRVTLFRYAFDRGVRYFDTAGNYRENHAILGEALKDRRREVCLVTKIETTKPEEVRKAVEKSLKELQTNYLDILLIHGTPGLEQMSVEQAMKIHAELVKLRDEKITRFIGFSAHGYFEKALALINSGGFDMCMLSYGYIPVGLQVWSARLTRLRDTCLAKAHELNMGIVAMKVMGAGFLGAQAGKLVPDFNKQKLKQLPAAAIRHVLQDQRVHILAIGMRLKEEVDANLKIISSGGACTPADCALLAEASARLHETDFFKKRRIE
jgi:predicted aldo/keto reductase-like oxidoreductase